MQIIDIIDPARIVTGANATSKKRALEMLSELLSDSSGELGQSEVFTALLGREKLGSTGLGHGVALPHGRLGSCSRPVGALVVLAEAIDFDAVDGEPVDILFAMLVPEDSTEEHLELLAQLAEFFGDSARCEVLRAKEPRDLYQLLTDWRPSKAMA
ncbi:MAG: PTS sugar transporter subunit IIA [Gammaproteobacteria bacterium]|nr:PTS sugar transporter subunit IIA [Gammaproteobacteria bacterium]